MTIEIPGCASLPDPPGLRYKLTLLQRVLPTYGKFALRTIFLVPAIFIPAVASAATFLPFAPISPQPDYVVTMVERLFAKQIKRSVTHH